MKKAVLSLSGGLDSSTLLAYLKHHKYDVECISFRYGSKHNEFENESAKKIAKIYKSKLIEIDLSNVFKTFDSSLLLSGSKIPEGHYTDVTMSKTVVPSRNIIFLSILSGHAWSIGANVIVIGIHKGDHAIYADCRAEFYKAMDTAIYLGTDKKVSIIAPFVDQDKIDILNWGLKHNVPYQFTRTCYKHQEIACGKCGSCNERLEAFNKNNAIDPIQYEA